MSTSAVRTGLVTAAQRHTCVEAELLYWAVLDDRDGLVDATLLNSGSRALPESLFDVVQAQIPVPIDGLHIVCAGAGNGRLVACGIEPDELKNIVDSHGADLLTLAPSKIPHELGIDQGSSPELNLLVGPFEPTPVRSARNRIKRTVLVSAVSVCALLLFGVELRTWACNTRHNKFSAANEEVLRTAGFKTLDDLSREESRLRSINRSAGRSQDALSAIQSISTVIGAWPRGEGSPFVRTDAIQAAHDAIGLTVAAESSEDAEKLIEALKRVKGWTLAQPQYSRSASTSSSSSARTGSADSLTLRLRLTKEPRIDSRTELNRGSGERGLP